MEHTVLAFLSVAGVWYACGVCTGIGIGLLIASAWLRKAGQ